MEEVIYMQTFLAKDEKDETIMLFYIGKEDFKTLMPGSIYEDSKGEEYVVISVDCPTSGGIPSKIKVMKLLLNEKLTKFIMLEDGPYSIAALEELLFPLGFKIVFK